MAVAVGSQTTPLFGTAQTMAVDIPAGFTTDEVVVFFGTHTGTLGTLPGSVDLKENSNNVFVAYLHHADWVTDGTPSSYTFTTTSTFADIVSCWAIRFTGAMTSGDPFDGIQTGANTAQTVSPALSITTTEPNSWVGYLDSKTANRTVTVLPSEMTQFSTVADPTFMHGFEKIQATAGAVGPLTATFSPGSAHNSALFGIKAAGAAGPPPGGVIVGNSKKVITGISTIVGGVKTTPGAPATVIVGGVQKGIPT